MHFLSRLLETVGAIEDKMEAAAAVARAVAERLGGPAADDESLAQRWVEASYEVGRCRLTLLRPRTDPACFQRLNHIYDAPL